MLSSKAILAIEQVHFAMLSSAAILPEAIEQSHFTGLSLVDPF